VRLLQVRAQPHQCRGGAGPGTAPQGPARRGTDLEDGAISRRAPYFHLAPSPISGHVHLLEERIILRLLARYGKAEGQIKQIIAARDVGEEASCLIASWFLCSLTVVSLTVVSVVLRPLSVCSAAGPSSLRLRCQIAHLSQASAGGGACAAACAKAGSGTVSCGEASRTPAPSRCWGCAASRWFNASRY
jgi:hypothetical protein